MHMLLAGLRRTIGFQYSVEDELLAVYTNTYFECLDCMEIKQVLSHIFLKKKMYFLLYPNVNYL